MRLIVKKTDERANLPFYATDGAAGMDLSALLEEPLTLPPLGKATVSTGLAVKLPEGTVGLVFGRSGLGIKHGITLSNSVGVIDSDYVGEIRIGLVNISEKPYTIENGERIAQLAVVPVCRCDIEPAEKLPQTARGSGGFGSTGRK